MSCTLGISSSCNPLLNPEVYRKRSDYVCWTYPAAKEDLGCLSEWWTARQQSSNHETGISLQGRFNTTTTYWWFNTYQLAQPMKPLLSGQPPTKNVLNKKQLLLGTLTNCDRFYRDIDHRKLGTKSIKSTILFIKMDSEFSKYGLQDIIMFW